MFNKTSRPETQQDTAQPSFTEEVAEPGAQDQDTASDNEISAQSADNENWKEKYQQLQEQYTRLAADFENFRKRSREEQDSALRYGAQKSIMELLPVLDNLDRANTSLNENSDPKTLYKSFSLMQKQLLDGLESIGVRKLNVVGQPFDPQLHEAVNRMPSNDIPENSIMYEAQSGYQLHDKVIRPALVVVSTGSAEGASAEPASAGAGKTDAENRANPFTNKG